MISSRMVRPLGLSRRLYGSVSEVYKPATNSSYKNNVYSIPENKADFGNYQRTSFQHKITNEEAARSSALIALHARLRLSDKFEYSTLARGLTCRSNTNKENGLADNFGLSLFGKNLLTYYATEYLIVKYPRLPLSILNAAVDSYIGKYALLDLGKNIWGIEEDTKSDLTKYLNNEPKEYAFGKLRYDSSAEEKEDGIVAISKESALKMDKASAYASAVRSIVAGIYAHDGESETKKFINSHILSRKLDIASMFEFTQPIRQLSRLLQRENLPAPTSRLIAENGRLSSNPIFIVGIFSGNDKLGEGQGPSILKAKTDACINSLKQYYLYSPLEAVVPSVENNFRPAFIDKGGEAFV
ncbi:hypothetical protein LJB42_003939 [Komagataella kurtzmanii]|nr:hypothetical protein LJB42_003939 [Komagataella kurtzmanii]